jgi:hypothetical protein
MSGIRKAADLVVYPQAHPVALDVWLLAHFQSDYVTWEPETLWAEIRRVAGYAPSAINRNKIQAIRLIHTQNSPFVEWEIFEKVIQALDGTVPDFAIMQPPSVPQMLAGVDTAWTIHSVKLSDEVKRYCAACFLDGGVMYAPEPLREVNPLLTKYAPPGLQKKILERLSSNVPLQEDDLVDVQTAKVKAGLEYLSESRQRLLAQVSLVRSEVPSA